MFDPSVANRVCCSSRFFVGLLLVLPLLTAGQAQAQAITGVVPVFQEPAGGTTTSPMLETARTVVAADSRLVAQPAVPVDRLRHLPAILSGWRVNGEMGSLQWPVYLAAGEAAATRRFRLTYRSSASVLPDISFLVLTINDAVVGRSGIASPANIKPVEFDVPPDVLRRGFNSVKISVEQRHRVDCSLDATYELFTQILPATSGFLVGDEADRSQIDLSDLAALRPRSDGALPIEVVLEGRMKPQRVDRVLLAAQAIAMIGQFQMPIVHFGADKNLNAGVKLLVGTEPEIASLIDRPEGRSPMVGPTTFLLPSRSNGAPTLVLSGPTEDDVTVAVGLLATLAKVPMIGTSSGQRAAQNLQGLPVSGGERIRLSDLGFSSVEFSGRFFRLGIDIAMPADFLAADYAKLTIDLAGGYAAGLNSDAQVRVEVNGRNGANVALPNSSGDVFRHNEIYVPLGMLRPGSNRIEILAQLPNQSDVACDTAGPVDKDAKRFLLLSSTEIRFPAIARLGRTPDLMLTTAGGFPYTTAASPRLVVPTPDRESLSAAATLAVRLAVAARDLIPFTFTLARPGETTDHTLIVAPAQALDPELMKAIGLDPDAVRRVWENRALPESAAAPLPPARVVLRHTQTENSAAPAGQPGGGPTEPKPAPSIAGGEVSSSAASTEIVDRWSGMVGKRAVWDGFPDVIKSIGRHTSNASAAVMSVVRSQGTKAKTPESNAIDARASLIVAQGQRPGSDTGAVTIVTAPDSRTLLQSAELLMDPVRWSNLRGRLSVMDASGDLVGAVEAAHVRYLETQPRSFGNARLIAAGWFSLNPAAYVISALLMAGILAMTTLSLIRNSGRSSK
jgi:cellulose synthase operon protein B